MTNPAPDDPPPPRLQILFGDSCVASPWERTALAEVGRGGGLGGLGGLGGGFLLRGFDIRGREEEGVRGQKGLGLGYFCFVFMIICYFSLRWHLVFF